MTSMPSSAPVATVFGGSGFIGRYVTQRLARAGWRVRVAVRRPDEAYFVRPYGVVGQVEPVQANIRDDASTRRAVARRRRRGQLRRHPGRERQAELRGGGRRGRRPRRPPRRRGGRRRGWSTSRPSAPTPTAPASTPAPRPTARPRCAPPSPRAVILRPVDRLRHRGPVLQPLRRHGAHLAGAARDRRPTPASSRSTSTTSPPPPPWRRPPTSAPASTSSAARRSPSFRELMQRMLAIIRAPPPDRGRCRFGLARAPGPRLRLPRSASPAASSPTPSSPATRWRCSRRDNVVAPGARGFAELGIAPDRDGRGARELPLRLPRRTASTPSSRNPRRGSGPDVGAASRWRSPSSSACSRG